MTNIIDLMQLCRLCLVKDKVNVPIFDEQDTGQILLKISACLPVKVSKEDSLPKNICDGCSSKLDTLYQFWKISANSEKQLLKLLNQLELDKTALSAVQHSINSDSIILKQEVVDIGNSPSPDDDLVSDNLNVSNDGQDYLMPQQQMPYQFDLQPDDFPDPEEPAPIDSMATITSKMLSKKRAILPRIESDEEDVDDVDMPSTKIAKTEELSDESENEAVEPTTFVPTNDIDNEQPGPSGIGKSATVVPSVIPCSVKLAKIDLFELKEEMLSIKEDLESEEEMPTSISKYTCYACKNGRTYTRKQLCSHFKRVHKGKRMRDMKFHKDYAISCEICWKNFLSKKTYKLHIEKHSNQFICETCAACFKKLSDYTIHLRLHSTENNFKCILCDVVTDTIVEIREHIRKVHSKKILYSCKICRKVFPVHAWHAQHANYHANIRPYRCKICRKRFTYDRYVTIHKNKDHPEKSEEPPAKKPVDAREEKPKKPPKKSHQCVICKNSYYNSGSLNRHMNTHSGNLAVCDFCGKRCLDNMKLKIHRRTHTGEKPYCCTVCGKCFISMERLKEHERVHTGEKPYKCEECGRGFTQKSPLKIHMRTHTGERPYICRLCNKGFISGGSMNIHLKKCDGGPSNRH